MHIGALQLQFESKEIFSAKVTNLIIKLPFMRFRPLKDFFPPVRMFPELGKIWSYKFGGSSGEK